MTQNADSGTVMNVAAELARKAHWADEYSEDLGNWMRYQSRRLSTPSTIEEQARLAVDRLFPAPVATVEETQSLLRVSRSTVFDLLAAGKLRSVRLGRRRLIFTESIVGHLADLDAEQNGAG